MFFWQRLLATASLAGDVHSCCLLHSVPPFEVLIIGIGHWDIPYLILGMPVLRFFLRQYKSTIYSGWKISKPWYCKVPYIFNQESTINQPLKDLLKLTQINSVEWPSSSVYDWRGWATDSEDVVLTLFRQLQGAPSIPVITQSIYKFKDFGGSGDSGDSQLLTE